jgi:U3 small nucleolar ribonucleoprotein protein IMP4
MQAASRRILVTTSHRPSQRVRSFVKDLASVLPNAVRRNRGKATMRDLYYEAVSIGANRVVIVGGRKGNPGVISVYEPAEPPEEELRLLARLSLAGVRLSRETPGAQRSYGARSLGVHVESSSDELSMLGDLLIRLFNARLILDLERAHRVVDVVAVVRPGGAPDAVAEVTFLCAGSGRQCGPTLRLKGVYDYVSGFRLYRGEASREEAGGGGS